MAISSRKFVPLPIKPQPPRAQAGILDDLPEVGRYLFFTLSQPSAARDTLRSLQALADGKTVVVGVGHSLAQGLGITVPGLRPFPTLPMPGAAGRRLPADDTALWCWLRASATEDLGHLVQKTHQMEAALGPAFALQRVTDGFAHARSLNGNRPGHGHDLTGYEDGTENPTGKAARTAALTTALEAGRTPGLEGSSFVAVQQWQHDFKALERMSPLQRDHMIGRRQTDNEELDDAPASAHVKRTAQESFSPEAFVLRRSMPWAQGRDAGLMFVAFGHNLDAFEAQMRRMAGLDDGVVDAMFQVSQPISGAYFWCPPRQGRRLDLTLLGVA